MIHIHSCTVEAVLAGNGLPEGSTDLVTLDQVRTESSNVMSGVDEAYALTGLKVDLYSKKDVS